MPEGRIVPDSAGNAYAYEYFIKDHLGNTRAIIDHSSQILEHNDYYPFGMPIAALSYTIIEPQNKYLYNGKWQRSEHPDLSGELQDAYNLDWFSLSRCIGKYGARMYDAQICRFPSLDPKADQFAYVSPYNYAENRPVDGIDLWGTQRKAYQELETNNVPAAKKSEIPQGTVGKETKGAITIPKSSKVAEVLNTLDRAVPYGDNYYNGYSDGANTGFSGAQDWAVAGAVMSIFAGGYGLFTDASLIPVLGMLTSGDDLTTDENGQTFGERIMPNEEYKAGYDLLKAGISAVNIYKDFFDFKNIENINEIIKPTILFSKMSLTTNTINSAKHIQNVARKKEK